jgi:hypothetical protein
MKKLELPSSAEMSATARAGEIAGIVAAAIVRTHLALAPEQRAVDLGFPANQRVHTTPYPQEKL